MSSLRIASLGAGAIGGVLGRKWAKAGHNVAFGVKDPASEKARRLREELGEQLLIGSPAEVLAESDVVLLAVPGDAVEKVVAAHAQLLDHKIIIDATNQVPPAAEVPPVAPEAIDAAEATEQWLSFGPLNSLSTLQAHVPHARIYRIFNSYAWETFANPLYQGIQADLFYCGPTGDGLMVVEQLISEIGLRPVRLGDLETIGLVDGIVLLWGALALLQGWGRDNVAFKVLTR